MRSSFPARVGITAIGLALVVGCGGDDDSKTTAGATSTTVSTSVPATTTSSTSTTTPPASTTTTTVDPSATEAPLTARSRIHARGAGPIHAGMTVREAARVVDVPLAIEAFDAFEGRCYYAVPEGLDGLSFMVSSPDGTLDSDPLDGTIVRAEARQPAWQTLAGVHPGSTEADVTAAYGIAVETEPHTYQPGGHYLTVPGTGADAGFGIRFETSPELVVENIFSGDARAITAIEGCA